MCIERRMRAARRQRGASLIELILFIVIVSVGIAGILPVLNEAVRRSADPLVVKRGMAAADAMLEEVLLKDFADPSGGWSGAATVANRPNFDNVQDYSGYSSTGVYALTDTATPVVGLESYNVAVAVANPAAAISGVPVADILQVTVTVTYGTQTYTATGYRFNND